jgi:hypothetical protein
VKRKEYTSRGEKQNDFFVGYFIMAALIVLLPLLASVVAGGGVSVTGGSALVPVAAIAFLIAAGIYRPWMAVGGLGCLGTLIALGLLVALFFAVVCSSGFR